MILDPAMTWNLLRVARSGSRRSSDWLQHRQEGLLRQLLVHAYEKVPLYRQLYDAAGFHPASFRTIRDLPRIPLLTKKLLKDTPLMEAVATGTDLARCQLVSTSGSTGQPLRVALGRYEQCWHRAVAWRVLFEHGFSWTDRTLEIRMQPGPIHRLQKLGLAPKEWLSIIDPPAHWAERLSRGRHECVVAGAGTLELLAEAARSWTIQPPRIVVSDSEPLTPTARRKIREALGTDPIDVYGLAEVSNFAWQCEQRSGFHLSADSHVVEVDAAPGETGGLIVTALGMRTMPIIRYETGDLAAMEVTSCGCGRGLPILKSLDGRSVESIQLGSGQPLLWPFFHEVLGAESEITQWQVCQVSTNHLRINAVFHSDPSDLALEGIRLRVAGRLSGTVSVEIIPVPHIVAEASGKRRLVIPYPGARTEAFERR